MYQTTYNVLDRVERRQWADNKYGSGIYLIEMQMVRCKKLTVGVLVGVSLDCIEVCLARGAGSVLMLVSTDNQHVSKHT